MPSDSRRPASTSSPAEPASGYARRYLLYVVVPMALGAAWLTLGSTPSQIGPNAVLSAATTSLLQTPLVLFLLQLLVILAAAKVAGVCARRLGQPEVIGEILAGIALGPTLFGHWLPQWQSLLFPASSLATLSLLGQLGVLVFMFSAGAEFDLQKLRGQRRQALVISHAGLALPMLLGVVLAGSLYAPFAPAQIGFVEFALFLGAALSVTAFPVLLRIIDARGYREQPVGRLAIASAAISDASAWTLLALIFASARAESGSALLLPLLLAVVLGATLLGPVRHWLATREGQPSLANAMVPLILGALACALATELLGLHLVFGAFLAGVAVSSSSALRRIVDDGIRPFAAILLLPVYFASSGLSLDFQGLSGSDWLWALVLIAAATVGKGGATVFAARRSGVSAADSWRLGALMNTRGLMELIVLSLGYELGLINERLFAILVAVAIVTTLMTGPALSLIDRAHRRARN